MGSQQQFCLRWNNHQSNMLTVFDNLFQNEALVDVTLACEGLSLKAHKMVLSACSPFFQSLFIDNPCKHPIVILKDVRFTDLKALVDFMYKGEVNVSQDQLNRLLKTAETLKVRGLAEVTSGYCIEENGNGGGVGGAAGGPSGAPSAPSEAQQAVPQQQPQQPQQQQQQQQTFENRNSRSPPPQPQMSPPRKRKKTKHRSRSGAGSGGVPASAGETKPASHSEQEESDNPEMLEPKVFAGGTASTPTSNSRPSLAGTGTAGATQNQQNSSGMPSSSTPTCTTSPERPLSNQSPSLQNASQDFQFRFLDHDADDGSLQSQCVDDMCEAELTVCAPWPDIVKTSNEFLMYSSGSDEDYELRKKHHGSLIFDKQTNIGNDVLVPKRKLELLLSMTCHSPTKFVRGLLMLVFSKDELRGRSVTGRQRHLGGIKKDALDCGKLTAVVDYTVCVFPSTSIVKIRQTISNKLKEVNSSSSIWERLHHSVVCPDDVVIQPS